MPYNLACLAFPDTRYYRNINFNFIETPLGRKTDRTIITSLRYRNIN